MNILALEPYYGGSHRAFLDGWIAASRHDWTCLTLPAHHWKWRMRHAPVTFADTLHRQPQPKFQLLFTTDMLSLAVFRGLAPPKIARLPAVVYFHENQLTYPDAFRGERDFHYAFDNFQTMLAADQVWFNSAFHRTEFLSACQTLLDRFPDYPLNDQLELCRDKSRVAYPGLPEIAAHRRSFSFEVPHIVWAARWERDKNPEDFFAALREWKQQGHTFRLSVVGESFRDSPPIFAEAKQEFAKEIVQWGFLADRGAYLALLQSTDLFISTAAHEFFGISAAEAILAGNLPVLPQRLAYPELVEGLEGSALLYDGTVAGLVRHLNRLASDESFRLAALQQQDKARARLTSLRWSQLAPLYDDCLEELAAV